MDIRRFKAPAGLPTLLGINLSFRQKGWLFKGAAQRRNSRYDTLSPTLRMRRGLCGTIRS